MVPSDRKYMKSHEWVMDMGDGKVRIGISDHAQEEMGDLVYIELPEVGDEFNIGDGIAVVESVKAVSDVYTPAAGRVSAVNEELLDDPALVNEDAYEAWMVELEDYELGEVMSAEEYEETL